MDQTGPQQGPSGPAFGGGYRGGGKEAEAHRDAREARGGTEPSFARDYPGDFIGGEGNELKKTPEREDHGNRIRGYEPLAGHVGIIGAIPQSACVPQARAMTGREMLRRKTAHLRAEGHALIEEAKTLTARAEDRLREARNIDDLVALLPDFTGIAPGADQALVRLAAGY